jgi:hypothetical protein
MRGSLHDNKPARGRDADVYVTLCQAGITAMNNTRYHNSRYEYISWITETANDDRPARSGDIR